MNIDNISMSTKSSIQHVLFSSICQSSSGLEERVAHHNSILHINIGEVWSVGSENEQQQDTHAVSKLRSHTSAFIHSAGLQYVPCKHTLRG